jgi:uncharacterized SAM-binding protein YcdF (DUF218 family)
VAIVLGNQVQPSGVPHPRLQDRLNKAWELYVSGRVKNIIVSGGLGKEGHQEAEIMQRVLMDQNIEAQAIWVDKKGNTTFQTAQNAALSMKKNNWNSAFVVSQYYHIARCKLAFHGFGIDPVFSAPAEFNLEWREPYSLLREFVGYYYYLLRRYPPSRKTRQRNRSSEDEIQP